MCAILTATTIAVDKDRDSILTIMTPLNAMIKMIKGEYIRREDEDWHNFPLKEEWRMLLNILRQRTQRTTFLKNNPKSSNAEKAKQMATRALSENEIQNP